jgi:quinol monooxygenase YgiN
VFRSAGDPNEIVLVFEWDSVQNAQAFAQSADLRETMEKAGVVDMPTLLFLEEIGAVPA